MSIRRRSDWEIAAHAKRPVNNYVYSRQSIQRPIVRQSEVKRHKRGIMVNARLVNGAASHSQLPHFCEFFRAFALIPRFRNPLKYTRSFHINHETVHSGCRQGLRHPLFIARIQ